MQGCQKNIAAGLLVLALRAAPNVHGADRVDLLSGDVFYGQVLKETDDEVAIQLASGGVLTFKRSGVRHVRRASEDLPEDSIAPTTNLNTGQPREKKPTHSLKRPQLESAVLPEAQIQPAPAIPSLRTDAPETLLTLEPLRLAISPPRGFRQRSEEKGADTDLSYWDPATGATFTLSSQKSPEPVEDLKKKALEACSKLFSGYTILRNERLKKSDKEAKPERWIVESECQSDKEFFCRIQVFAKRNDELFVLTYVTPRQNYEAHRASFEKSLDSLRFLEPAEDAQ